MKKRAWMFWLSWVLAESEIKLLLRYQTHPLTVTHCQILPPAFDSLMEGFRNCVSGVSKYDLPKVVLLVKYTLLICD